MIDEQLYTVETPEQIDLVYDVAGIGSRILAALIDHVLMLLVLSLGYVVVTLLIENILDVLNSGLVLGIFGILIFLFMCTYYIFFETTWNGQTPGKRIIGIRMVRVGGRPLGFLGSTIRNIIRLADFLPALYGAGVIVMFVDKQSRRLGDMAAGSLAVRERKAVTLDMLEVAPAEEPAVVAPADEQRIPNFRALRAEDFAMVESYLRRRSQISPEVRTRLDGILIDGMEQRLGYPIQRDPFNVEQFLGRVAAEHLLVQQNPNALGNGIAAQTPMGNTPDVVPQPAPNQTVAITGDTNVEPLEGRATSDADVSRAPTTTFDPSAAADEPRATTPLGPPTTDTSVLGTTPDASADSASRDQS